MKRPKRRPRKTARSLSTLIEAADDDTVAVTRDHGRYMTAPVGPVPLRPAVIPPGVVAVKQHGRDTHPLAFRGQPSHAPPAALPAPVDRPPLAIAVDGATPAEKALTILQLKVKGLASPDPRTGQNKLDRVSEDKLQAMGARRRDGLRQPRDTAYLIVEEAAALLRGGREPWNPDGAA